MTTFAQIKAAYRAGSIGKPAFVQAMYDRHAVLFDHGQHLGECNLGEIRINRDEVVAVFKDPPVTMVCPPRDARIAPIEAFNFGDYEHDEIQLVRRIVALLGGPTVQFFDIGANAGFYSLALSHYFPGITGVAFEPVPTTYAHLLRNFALNGVTRIVACNCGLSQAPGELVFYTYPSQSGSSSMTRNVDSADVQEVRCTVRKLDDYCAEHRATIDFIKCDVEGAELFVFQGGAEVIRRDRPAIFTEMLRKWCAKYNYHPNDIIAHFHAQGYGCFVVRAGRLEACDQVTPTTIETNFIFLHREKHGAILATLTA